ncbi:MAG: hypothetical protein V4658_05515, partial [Bacteroidota bacterium]
EELNQTRAHHVYTGKEGTLWVCTDLGLWKIKPYNNSFKNHLTNTDNNLFNRVNNAYSMRALLPLKNATMLVSTYKGFLTYDAARKTILKKILFPDRKVMRSAPFVRQMIEEPEGIWAVVEDGSLVLYDKNAQEFRLAPVTFRPDDMPIHDFFAVLKQEGQLWIGTTNGLYVYTISNGRYHEFSARLRGVSVYQLTRLMDHTVALSTSEGLFIAAKNGIVQQYTSMQLPSNEVNCTIETDTGILYAGTSNGLCRINTRLREIRSFTTSEGLCDNYINCIRQSRDRALWLSTNYGLSRFDLSNYSFVNFYKKNGLCENEFNRWSGATDEKGNLYFGTVNGLVSFDPLLYNASRKNIPDLFISSFTRHSNRLDSTITSAYFNPHHLLSLSVKDNFIEFGLGLTSYTDVQNNRYYYKLTRKQNKPGDWIPVGNQNKVRLNNLVSGAYTLQFKGINSEGYESANIISFPLTISEVFYKTWW